MEHFDTATCATVDIDFDSYTSLVERSTWALAHNAFNVVLAVAVAMLAVGPILA